MHQLAKILEEKGDEVFAIEADATVFEAIKRMVEANVGALLVTDKGEGNVGRSAALAVPTTTSKAAHVTLAARSPGDMLRRYCDKPSSARWRRNARGRFRCV